MFELIFIARATFVSVSYSLAQAATLKPPSSAPTPYPSSLLSKERRTILSDLRRVVLDLINDIHLVARFARTEEELLG